MTCSLAFQYVNADERTFCSSEDGVEKCLKIDIPNPYENKDLYMKLNQDKKPITYSNQNLNKAIKVVKNENQIEKVNNYQSKASPQLIVNENISYLDQEEFKKFISSISMSKI